MKLIIMIVEAIRKHIETCGKTRYRISQDTGVDEATLCRIAAGKAKACSTKTADILCEYLGLELLQKKSKKKRGK